MSVNHLGTLFSTSCTLFELLLQRYQVLVGVATANQPLQHLPLNWSWLILQPACLFFACVFSVCLCRCWNDCCPFFKQTFHRKTLNSVKVAHHHCLQWFLSRQRQPHLPPPQQLLLRPWSSVFWRPRACAQKFATTLHCWNSSNLRMSLKQCTVVNNASKSLMARVICRWWSITL